MELDNLLVASGGGATNSAFTFGSLGLKTGSVFLAGHDVLSQIILSDLKKSGVKLFAMNTECQQVKEATNVSLILSPQAGRGDRAILSYWGKENLTKDDIPWDKIKQTKWFYIAPLHKKAIALLADLVKFAKKNNIKTAVNPSVEQIIFYRKNFPQVDILLLNEQEAQMFFPQVRNQKQLLAKIAETSGGIVAITQGQKGCIVWDGKKFYSAQANPKIIAKERTGAGDAFGSGFTAGLFLKNNIQYGIRLGLANSESCIQQVGAKNGLLTKQGLLNLPNYNIL